MNIIISNALDVPIYIQVYTQIKNMIIKKELLANELIPSVRNLAKDLKISVITSRRAYEELERDGYIYTVVGKGSFVADLNMELVKEHTLIEIENEIKKVRDLAKRIDLTKQELLDVISLLIEEEL